MKHSFLLKPIFTVFCLTALLLSLSHSVFSDCCALSGTEEALLRRFTFFGESTTVHLRSRGGIPFDRVWANESGTMKLDSSLLSKPLTDPKTGDHINVSQAVTMEQPDILVLSFGLNGICGFSRNTDGYIRNYKKLIAAVQKASPSTHIAVQSVYPVAVLSRQLSWNFSDSPAAINREILELNRCLEQMCRELSDVCYIDTASVLKDADGFLRADYSTDGIHLTGDAYREILHYLCLHISIE